jgi:hypothetical protein
MADNQTKTPTEQIPSVRDGISAIASAGAPIIFVDEFPNSGYYNGICHITCEALRFLHVDKVAVTDRVLVAHLRMNYQALQALKAAIANVEAMIGRDGATMPPPHRTPGLVP